VQSSLACAWPRPKATGRCGGFAMTQSGTRGPIITVRGKRRPGDSGVGPLLDARRGRVRDSAQVPGGRCGRKSPAPIWTRRSACSGSRWFRCSAVLPIFPQGLCVKEPLTHAAILILTYGGLASGLSKARVAMSCCQEGETT
jgi:hypothetical protein